jgi:hypothetical protein
LTAREEPVNTFARRTKMTVNGTVEAKRASGMIMQKETMGKIRTKKI